MELLYSLINKTEKGVCFFKFKILAGNDDYAILKCFEDICKAVSLEFNEDAIIEKSENLTLSKPTESFLGITASFVLAPTLFTEAINDNRWESETFTILFKTHNKEPNSLFSDITSQISKLMADLKKRIIAGSEPQWENIYKIEY